MRAELSRRRREEQEGSLTGDEPVARRHPAAGVLDLQATMGNAAVTRLLAREVSTADKVAMKSRWGKDAATQKAHLIGLGPEEAYKAIAAFCDARKRGKNPPTIEEVRDELNLTKGQVKEPKQDKRVEGFAFSLDLLKRRGVEVGFDDHQNKHQIKKIFGLKDYTGGSADNKYGSYADANWHKTNTAPIAERWVRALSKAGSLDPAGTKVQSSTGENLLNEGHLFVATALKDSDGILYVSYHCYPEVTDV